MSPAKTNKYEQLRKH